MSPSFEQMERFVATVRLGSYSAAADDLCVTPQTVSKSIHDLERKLNVQLFEARGKRLQPTYRGGAVYRYAVDALDARTEMHHMSLVDAQPPKAIKRSLSLAITTSPLRGRVFRESDFTPFCRAYPQISLKTMLFAGSACLAALESGMAQAAVIAGKPVCEGVRMAKIRTVELHALVSSRHLFAGRKTVTLADLHREKLAVPYDFRCCKTVVEQRLAQQGVKPHYVPLEMNEARHRAFLQEEGGVLLVSPDSHLHDMFPGTTLIAFAAQDRISLPYYFAWREGNETPEVALMCQYLRMHR